MLCSCRPYRGQVHEVVKSHEWDLEILEEVVKFHAGDLEMLKEDESVLKKEGNSTAYHFVREGDVANEVSSQEPASKRRTRLVRGSRYRCWYLSCQGRCR